uniref:Fucosyltransferase n=1 Tax=Phallusia mammillata TaxID=59560 RepID=A0A6F9DCN5_9ASCI|nr:alpha-(1,3)-fucosyltransferase 11 [Phallusia mammillata]
MNILYCLSGILGQKMGKLKLNAVLITAVTAFLTLAFFSRQPHGKKSDSNTPLILWWTKELYPHILKSGNENDIHDVYCPRSGLTCQSTQNREVLEEDGNRLISVFIYGTDFRAYEAPLPRKPNHLWALFHEESPQNNHMLCHMEALSVFNYSATFKRKSDFPLTTQHFPNKKYITSRKPISIEEKNRLRKEGLAPIVYLISHCDVPSDRDRYVYNLMGNISIDSYGACLHNKDFKDKSLTNTGKMLDDELYDILAKYKFQIAFENSNCDDYITEKFTRPFHIGSVPIYKGSSSARDWAPSPYSVIMVDDFESPASLAEFIRHLDENDEAYLKYLDYKNSDVIPNSLLRETLENRTWTLDGNDHNNFVGGYECYLCEQMHELKNRGESGQPIIPRVVPHSHLDCPPPEPSFGTIADIPPNNPFHNWVNDYWQSLDQAVALRDMVRDQVTDPEHLWSYIERRYHSGHGALQHTEL